MKLNDELYGEFVVEEVLEKLIYSKAVQRLKGIHQGGASYLVNERWNLTRYEHSIGVMLLIKKLGGKIEEQIAGLLHDVSHTAFSHVVDDVLNYKNEDYHEFIFKEVITKSDIPDILKDYGYNYKDILFDDSQWTILEQPLPALCADRIDYTLRDMYSYGKISMEEVSTFLQNLKVVNGRLCIRKVEAAEWFVAAYYKEVIDFFLHPLNVYGYFKLAQILRKGIEKGIITKHHFLMEDIQVIAELRGSEDEEIICLLKELKDVQVEENKTDYQIHMKKKVRLIDPDVAHEEKLIPASRISDKVKTMNDQAYEKASKGIYIKVNEVNNNEII